MRYVNRLLHNTIEQLMERDHKNEYYRSRLGTRCGYSTVTTFGEYGDEDTVLHEPNNNKLSSHELV
jgi:hypothetical protein